MLISDEIAGVMSIKLPICEGGGNGRSLLHCEDGFGFILIKLILKWVNTK